MRFLLVAGRLALTFLTLCAFTGCVTRGYKLAPKDTPPPVPLNLGSASDVTPAVEAVVNTVIVYQGPGSWKREAYWDEYVLTISNRGETPLILTGASLHAHNGETVTPGDSPWPLDRAGKTWWQTNAAQQTGTYLLLGAGSVASVGVVALGVVASGGILAPATGSAAVAIGVGTVAFAAIPVYAIGTVAMNYRRKHQIQDEFNRRRLGLPLTLAPGASVQGSLFFRITPSPRELVLHGEVDGPDDVSIPLIPLAGLHLRLPVQSPQAAAK